MKLNSIVELTINRFSSLSDSDEIVQLEVDWRSRDMYSSEVAKMGIHAIV